MGAVYDKVLDSGKIFFVVSCIVLRKDKIEHITKSINMPWDRTYVVITQ